MTPPIDSDIGPISTPELSKLCKNEKIIEIQRKNWSLCLGHHRAIMYQEEKNGKGFRYLKAGQASNYPVKIETANFRASTLCKQHSNIIYVVGFPLWVLETREKLSLILKDSCWVLANMHRNQWEI